MEKDQREQSAPAAAGGVTFSLFYEKDAQEEDQRKRPTSAAAGRVIFSLFFMKKMRRKKISESDLRPPQREE
jgi:hypothetical protein